MAQDESPIAGSASAIHTVEFRIARQATHLKVTFTGV